MASPPSSNTSTIDTTPQDGPHYSDSIQRSPGYLYVDSLVKHYATRTLSGTSSVKAIDDVSLNVDAGEVMGVVGESGCGKSTFARLITRLTTATSGAVTINGENWLAYRGEDLRRRRPTVQLVFQNTHAALDPRMKIGVSMQAPLAQHRIGTKDSRRDRVSAMLEEVGLDDSFYDRRPQQCSGGQLQRVVIGRALLLDPGLLICDEPTSALDASMTTQILNLLMQLKQRRGLTMVLISHDLRVVRFLCDRIAVMYLGKLVEVATTENLFENPSHPYTQSLIAAAMIDRQGLNSTDALIQGELPSPYNPPTGCTFHTRCPHSQDECTILQPPLRQTSADHYVRCHFWRKIMRDYGPRHDANDNIG